MSEKVKEKFRNEYMDKFPMEHNDQNYLCAHKVYPTRPNMGLHQGTNKQFDLAQ